MMDLLHLDRDNALAYCHHAPARDGAPSFVFVNALTGSTAHWETEIAPALRQAGFGTLSYNFRGQSESPFTPGTALTPALIVADLTALMDRLRPARPILVGLSIGGLFAAQAIAAGADAGPDAGADAGADAEALVLLNTLREIGPRIAWINDALPALVGHGGVALFMDAILPLLVNPEFAASARGAALAGHYAPLAPDHGHMNLMQHASAADWDFPWHELALPVLNITGLHDRVFLDRDVLDRLYATLPDARCEIWADAGHLLPLERPAKLARSLEKFGAEIEARR